MSDVERADAMDRVLEVYLDGELGFLQKWRLERQLERTPALRERLDELARIGSWVREIEARPQDEDRLDLWSGIAPGLAAIDQAVENPTKAGWFKARPPWLGWSSLAAAGALALFLATSQSGILRQGQGGVAEYGSAGISDQRALRYLNTGGHSVMVSQAGEKTTIIWLMDSPADSV